MRCNKFEASIATGLQSQGFTISDDGEIASMVDGIKLDILQSAKTGKFFAEITLPNGLGLMFPLLQIDMNTLLDMEEAED